MNDFGAETLRGFHELLRDGSGEVYTARVCGRATAERRWEVWLAFEPAGGGRTLFTDRETTQPNHTAAVYWATGLTRVYLEGALVRALDRQGPARPLPRRTIVDAHL